VIPVGCTTSIAEDRGDNRHLHKLQCTVVGVAEPYTMRVIQGRVWAPVIDEDGAPVVKGRVTVEVLSHPGFTLKDKPFTDFNHLMTSSMNTPPWQLGDKDLLPGPSASYKRMDSRACAS